MGAFSYLNREMKSGDYHIFKNTMRIGQFNNSLSFTLCVCLNLYSSSSLKDRIIKSFITCTECSFKIDLSTWHKGGFIQFNDT